MRNIYLHAGTISEVFTGLENSLDGVLNSANNELQLDLNNELIRGKIQGITFINGITAVQVELTFSDDVKLSMESVGTSSIVFAYCDGDSFQQSFGSTTQQMNLRKNHSAVISSNRSINTVLHFNKNTAVKFWLFKVGIASMAKADTDSLLFNLKKTFLSKQPDYYYEGVQNLKIVKQLSYLNTITAPGMAGHLLKKECIQSILEMEINDNTATLPKLSNALNRSVSNQINDIKKIYSYIKPFTIGSLYHKVIHSKNKILIKSFVEKV